MHEVRLELANRPDVKVERWHHWVAAQAWHHLCAAALAASRHPECAGVERTYWVDAVGRLVEGFECTFRTATGIAVVLLGVTEVPEPLPFEDLSDSAP